MCSKTLIILASNALFMLSCVQEKVTQLSSETLFLNSGEVTLAATLDLPAGKGPHPAVVMVHGSGMVRRIDYEARSRQLSAAGIAVLRYDKRGVGESTGIYSNVGTSNSKEIFAHLAADALAGVKYLITRPEINAGGVGLLGFSQAGWIIPLAASLSTDVAFMVNIVGPAVTVGQEIHYSKLTGDDPDGPGNLSESQILERYAAFGGPHGFDPVPHLRALSIPGLWVLGARDKSIPTAETVRILTKLTQEGKDFSVHVYDNAGHGLFDLDSGKRIDYFSQLVINWIKAQSSNKN